MTTVLKERANVSNYFCKYLLLHHAVQAQFGLLGVDLTTSPLEHLMSDPYTDKLVTIFYNALQPAGPHPFASSCGKWQAYLPDLAEEDWEEVTETFMQDVISTADKLTRFKFIHQLHYTPAKLNRMELTEQACCPRCGEDSANALHMFWAKLF